MNTNPFVFREDGPSPHLCSIEIRFYVREYRSLSGIRNGALRSKRLRPKMIECSPGKKSWFVLCEVGGVVVVGKIASVRLALVRADVPPITIIGTHQKIMAL